MNLNQFIEEALKEDVGNGDHTSLATIPENAKNKAKLLVKENGIIAGVRVGLEIFKKVDPDFKIEVLVNDGDTVKIGDIVLTVEGSSRNILTAERLVLNVMQRMSGVATQANKIQNSVKDTNTKVLDTRKTTPLLRALEKEAVKIGGAHNHRTGLYDMILIKDNHIDYAGGIKQAVEGTHNYLKENNLDLKVEVEVRDFEELNEVLALEGVDRVMLDNFSPNQLKDALAIIDGRLETEASGGITADNIRPYAETGVDYISIGALTHSVKGLDLSLKAC